MRWREDEGGGRGTMMREEDVGGGRGRRIREEGERVLHADGLHIPALSDHEDNRS